MEDLRLQHQSTGLQMQRLIQSAMCLKLVSKILILTVCITSVLYSQDLSRSSTLLLKSQIDSSGIADLVVQVFEDSLHTKLIEILITDDNGQVHLNCGKQDRLFITTSHLNYAPVGVVIFHTIKKKTIYLSPQTFQLKEAKVSAIDRGIRVKGDTVRFDLKVFRNSSQKDLKDLLKNLPGVQISEKGTIKYQGRKIDKILISGRDVARSQFTALNRIIVPQDLSSVQIIPGMEDPLNGQKAQYLDLVLTKENKLFLSLMLGIAHNRRTEEAATLLLTGERKFHHFSTVARKRLEQPALSASDALRARDLEIISLRKKNLPLTTKKFEILPPQKLGPKGSDIAFQYNGSMQERHSLDLYIQGFDRRRTGMKTIQILDLKSNQPIEQTDSRTQQQHQGLLSFIKWKFPVNKKLHLINYIQGKIDRNSEMEQGTSQFIDAITGYHQTKDIQNLSFDALQRIEYHITPQWKINIFGEYTIHKQYAPFSATSLLPIFEWSNNSGDSTHFDYQMQRQNTGSSINGEIVYEDKALAYGIKDIIHTLRLEETSRVLNARKQGMPFELSNSTRFFEHLPRLFFRKKSKKYSLNSELGILVNKQGGPSHSILQSSPYYKGFFTYIPAKKIELTTSISTGQTPFNIKYLWQTPTVVSTRYYQVNAALDDSYAFQKNANIILKYLRPERNQILFAGLSYSDKDHSIIGIPSIKQGYQITTFQRTNRNQSWTAQWFLLYNWINLTGNYTWSRASLYTPLGLSPYESRIFNPVMSFTPHRLRNPSIQTSISLNHTRQKIALLHSDQRYNRWDANILIRYKILQDWRIKAMYEMVKQSPFPNQHILSLQLDYTLLEGHFNLSLIGHDLLNFRSPYDYKKVIQPYFITEQSSLRLGGYILLLTEYRF